MSFDRTHGLASVGADQFASPSNKAFLLDVQDLMAGRRCAHVGRWRFSRPLFDGDPVNGIAIWNRLTERAKRGGLYYIFSDEVTLIRSCVAAIVSAMSIDTMLIDLGPGSEEAILDKIGVILEGAGGRISEYVAVDLVPEILTNAQALFKHRYPHLRFTRVQGDMFGPLTIPQRGPRVAAIFGQTLFNIVVNPFDHAAVKEKIVAMLAALKNHLRPGEKLLIPQNCCEDQGVIEAAYREQEEVWLNLFHRISRDLPVGDAFDPDAFAFEPCWIKASNILAHTAVPIKMMVFPLGEEIVRLSRGDRLYLHNTVVYPLDAFNSITEAGGFSSLATHLNAERRMALHILRAEQ